VKEPIADVWARIAAPLPAESISWRIDSKPKARDGKYFARFVCYVEAGTVRERLDSVVPGEWDLTLSPFGEAIALVSHEGSETQYAVKARLQVLGVVRECIGQGEDLKQAATDAFKRAAVRFGIGHELYAMEQNWVEVDGDGKYAKAVIDPQENYERRHGQRSGAEAGERSAPATSGFDGRKTAPQSLEEKCPKCGGSMFDNRATKRNPRAPDFKCKDRSCDGVVWPAKEKVADEDEPFAGVGAPLTRSPLIPDDAELPF
jgi:hypothetical protein